MEIEQDLVTRSASSTPFFIFNLFADYLLPYKNGQAWSQDLIYLLGLLDLTERAARTTLARMRANGWFDTFKEGRRSRYELTEMGRAIIAEGDKRIFETPAEEWDGQWQLVVYSLPEGMRNLRNELRTKLVWFGFGRLAPGTWITTHDRQSEIEAIITRLGIGEYASLFSGTQLGPISDKAIVAKCWDLSSLATQYEEYVSRWQGRLAQLDGKLDTISLEQRFVLRFWLTYEYQPFPRIDPNLPRPLLPTDWPGHTARQLFNHYRSILGTDLNTFLHHLPSDQLRGQ